MNGLTVGDAADRGSEDFAGAGLGQARDHAGVLECGDGADAVSDQGDQFGGDFGFWTVHAGFQDYQTDGGLAFQFVFRADHRAFGYGRVGGQDFLHLAGGEAMAGDVDDVVGATHDPDVAVVVDRSSIAGAIPAGEVGEVGGVVALVVLPESGGAAGR